MEELELLSLQIKVKKMSEVIEKLLLRDDVSDLERGRLMGLKSILNR
jgi:hypothetical protein